MNPTIEFRHCMDSKTALWGIVRQGRFIPFGDKKFCEELLEVDKKVHYEWKAFVSYPVEETALVEQGE